MGNPFRARRLAGPIIGLFCLAGAPAFSSVVSGTVFDQVTHAPLAHARVVFGWDRGAQQDSLATDSAGSFRFTAPSGCGFGCYVLVRMEGYWIAETNTSLLAPEENWEVEIGMQLIHSLAVRVVSAQDTMRPLDSAQAALFSDTNDSPRLLTVEPSGWAAFPGLFATPVYRLTVAAPGYRTSTRAFRFDGPKPADTVKIALDPDLPRTSKAVHGSLTYNGGSPYQGLIILRCRSALVSADLFAMPGADGAFSIRGVPAECDTGTLQNGYLYGDSLALSLRDADTPVAWDLHLPILGLRSGPTRVAPPWREGLGREGLFDLLGRRIEAARPRRLP